MGLRIVTISAEQNLETILLMQSSQRPMKESLLVAVEAVMLGFGRTMGLSISYAMDLQSNISEEVVRKSSFPCGKSR